MKQYELVYHPVMAPIPLGWCKSKCGFALLSFITWYRNTFLNKCSYVIHHLNPHFLLCCFFLANDLLLAVYIYLMSLSLVNNDLKFMVCIWCSYICTNLISNFLKCRSTKGPRTAVEKWCLLLYPSAGRGGLAAVPHPTWCLSEQILSVLLLIILLLH